MNFMDALSFVSLLTVSFLSAIMGTMVGMAMTVLLPVMIFLGIPAHTAVATGRFSAVGISLGNIGKFSRRQKIEMRYVLPFALAGIFGSLFGASFMVRIDEGALKKFIGIFMITVSLLVLLEDFLKPRFKKTRISHKHHVLSVLAGFFIGIYIGILGGGAATIVILLLILIYRLSFHDAVANQKAVTLPISLIATFVFMYQGLIDYRLGIPLFIVNIIGGWVGASLIMKFNPAWLKKVIVLISIALAIKLIGIL